MKTSRGLPRIPKGPGPKHPDYVPNNLSGSSVFGAVVNNNIISLKDSY